MFNYEVPAKMKIGYPPQMATVDIVNMKSRMGRATESHFAVLNTKIIERKQTSRSFDPSKVLNPALRATIKQEEVYNQPDFLKVKSLFMGEEAKKRVALQNMGMFAKARVEAETNATGPQASNSKS